MSIPVPNLDDRDFADLVAEALERMRQRDPQWTDLTVHDPGVVLVEAFAHLTDILLYRLNRVPDRLYATFLNLLGTSLGAPGAATVKLEFTRPKPGEALRIPRGTRVTCPPAVPGAAVPVFVTLDDALMAADATSVSVDAADVVLNEAVVVGTGTALSDDPALSARDPDGGLARHQPLRVVVGHRALPAAARLHGPGGALVVEQTHDVGAVLERLGAREVRTVLIEGGPTLLSAALRAGLVDELHAYVAPVLLGAGTPAVADLGVGTLAAAPRWRTVAVERLDDDVHLVLRPAGPLPTAGGH